MNSFNAFSNAPSVAALAAKLDKAGGTMTGALTLSQQALTLLRQSILATQGTGLYKYATNNIGVDVQRQYALVLDPRRHALQQRRHRS
jgi:hypothetical protein